MRPLDTSNTSTSRVTLPRAEARVESPTVPASNFNVQRMDKDADSLINALSTALNRSGVETTPNELRQTLANYVGNENNREALSRLDGVAELGGLARVRQGLEEGGHQGAGLGNVAVTIAAQALGREIRILQPNDNNSQQFREAAVIPANTDARQGETSAPIHLLQSNGSHYDLLESKATPQSAANSSDGASSSNQAASTSTTTPLTELNKATEAYVSFIGRELLAGKSPENASTKELQEGLAKLENVFDRYDDAVSRVDSNKRKGISLKTNAAVADARNTKHDIEDRLSDNIKQRFGVKQRKGRQEALKAMNLVAGRMTLELQRRSQQGGEVNSASNQQTTELLERLPKKLQQPSFKHDAKQLQKDLTVLATATAAVDSTSASSSSANPAVATPVADSHPVMMATERYKPFINTSLLGGQSIQTASPEQLRDGIKAFTDIVNSYSSTMEAISAEDSKGSRLRDKTLQKNLQQTKHSIEDSLGDNTTRRNGIERRDGRQGALKSMHLVHARLSAELQLRESQGGDPAVIQEGKELLAALANKLEKPGFRIDHVKLKADINNQLALKEVGVEKVAIMEGYVDDVADTLKMLKSEVNADGEPSKAWQSKTLDKIIAGVEKELDEQKKSLKPTLNESELADVGIRTNEILKDGYTKIAKHAQRQITQMAQGHRDESELSALKVLRDTALLAAQHHDSSQQVGIVTKAEHEFEESLPRHNRERIATAPTPGIDRSSTTSASVGLNAGFDLAEIGVSKVTPGQNGEEDTITPLHTIGARVGGTLSGQQTKSASISRANDGNLFSSHTTTHTGTVSGQASINFTTKAVENVLGDISVGAQASIGASRSKRTESVSLGSSPAVAFGSHHAPKLSDGQKAGGGIGRFAKLTGIDDAFGTRKLANISEASLKLGYNNDRDVAAGMHALLGNDVSTVYDRDGKPPLGEMFTSTSLESKPLADGQQAKSVMSKLFPDPLWESADFQSTSTRGNFSLQANATADVLGSAASSLSRPALRAGAKAGLAGSITVNDTSRTVRSAKLPHDIFNPGLRLSSRTAVDSAKDFFSNPTAANRTISKPIAEAMGFSNSNDYFTAVANSFDGDGPKVNNVDGQRLAQSYKTFQNDIKTIDQFFIQPEASLRKAKLPEVQAAIQRLNENYGAQLPSNITEANMGDFQAVDRKGVKEGFKQGKTESYQRFQDTAVAILSNFSAAGGAMKLMAAEGNPSPEQKSNLEQASAELLSSIESRSMPWNKKEMANRGTYVRQVVAEPFSHSVTTTLTGEALAFHGRKGGDYDVSGFIEDGAEALAGSSSSGAGTKVTKSKTTSTLADNTTDPGQTGITRNSVTTRQKNTLPYRDLREADGVGGKLKQTLLEAATFKKEIRYNQQRQKTQAYTATPGEDQKAAREFKAYSSTSTREERGVRAALGGTIPAGVLNVALGASRSQDKNDYKLENFTYGNDVGAMAIIGEKLFNDHNIDMKAVAAQIAASQQDGGPPFDFLDKLDQRFAEALLGDDRYDHMSAIVSKFRNAGFTEGMNSNGEKTLQHPTVTEDGMATASSGEQLHNSKGEPLDLSADKKYVDRAGFFGYAVARYDENLLQDAMKHWGGVHDVSFPDIKEIDNLLSKAVPSAAQPGPDGELVTPTRQQWLKSATMEERKDFYQNDAEGQQLLLNYLKVLSFSASVNDVIFQNNTHQMMHDQEQIERVDNLFDAPEAVAPESPNASGAEGNTTRPEPAAPDLPSASGAEGNTTRPEPAAPDLPSASGSEGNATRPEPAVPDSPNTSGVEGNVTNAEPTETSARISPAIAKAAEKFGGVVGQEVPVEEAPAPANTSEGGISPEIAKTAEKFGGVVGQEVPAEEAPAPANTSEGGVSPEIARTAEQFGGVVGQEVPAEEAPAPADVSERVISPKIAKAAEEFGGVVEDKDSKDDKGNV